ncbi:hypothetical protein NDU88_000234 [Pleurodeles waltl]|uniref:Uncharacterized protein n=1 Tax=Pleurodeles waltl TaxID=8319 RepID=A0AAV7KPR4_PLEWA|nr:hypothetical protein NDU88_000234 [Pleurodeles waltl]
MQSPVVSESHACQQRPSLASRVDIVFCRLRGSRRVSGDLALVLGWVSMSAALEPQRLCHREGHLDPLAHGSRAEPDSLPAASRVLYLWFPRRAAALAPPLPPSSSSAQLPEGGRRMVVFWERAGREAVVALGAGKGYGRAEASAAEVLLESIRGRGGPTLRP